MTTLDLLPIRPSRVSSSEKLIEKTLNSRCRKVGAWSIKLVPRFIKGLPDRLILAPGGRVFFVEVKTTGKKPTPAQLLVHRKLKGLGFNVYILDTLTAINNILELELC